MTLARSPVMPNTTKTSAGASGMLHPSSDVAGASWQGRSVRSHGDHGHPPDGMIRAEPRRLCGTRGFIRRSPAVHADPRGPRDPRSRREGAMADRRAKRIAEFIKPLRVTPGSKVKLSRDFDPRYKAQVANKEQGVELLQQGVTILSEYQARLAAQDQWGVLVVLQALDAAGKD